MHTVQEYAKGAEPDDPIMKTSQTYLTTKDVQDLIRVDKSTIYRMAEAGSLPAIKVGRQWRFPADGIERWLTGNGLSGNRRSESGATPRRAPSPAPAVLTTQDVADLFADLYGAMVVVTDIDGRPLTEVSNPCGYFAAISQHDGVFDRCVAEWKTLGGQYDLEPRLRPSHLGFLCARAYLRDGNELSGMVIAGGVAPDEWPPSIDEVRSIATMSGTPEHVVADHAADVHHLDIGQRAALVAALPRLAAHLSRIASRDRDISIPDETRSTS